MHTHALTLIIVHALTENTETHIYGGAGGGNPAKKKVKADVFPKNDGL